MTGVTRRAPPPIANVSRAIPLVNPGFEDNGVASPFSFVNQIQQHGWERGGAMVIWNYRHRCGIRSLSTGGSWGGGGFAYTQLTLPADAYNPVLDLYVNVESRVPSSRGVVDTLKLFVDAGTADMSPNTDFVGTGTPPAPMATWTNLDSAGRGFVAREVALPTTLRGQTIQLWLVSSINSEVTSLANNFNPTTTDFYVDDVSMWTAPNIFLTTFC